MIKRRFIFLMPFYSRLYSLNGLAGILFTLGCMLFPFQTAFACKCSDHPALSKEYCALYDVIFDGRVDSVMPCMDGFSVAYFTVKSIFKGESYGQTEVRFDCSSDCQMSFTKGEEWIIYSQYYKYGKLELNFCSRSRKQITGSDDYFDALNHMTYAEEAAYLGKNIGTRVLLKKEAPAMAQRTLIQPTAYWKLWLLLISLVCMYVIFYFVKKMP
jgi:hypothetical protein